MGMLKGLKATTALFGMVALAGAAQAAGPFTGVTAFGDSLSDAGNYAAGLGLPVPLRFTTNPGQTAIEDVAGFYGLTLTRSATGGTDYAVGSAGVLTNTPLAPAFVPTVTQQIAGYLAANPKLDPNRLYSVFGGANDIFYHATAVGAAAVASQLIAAQTAGLPAQQAAAVAAQIIATVQQQAGVAALETPNQAGLAINQAGVQEARLVGQMLDAGARYVVVFALPDIGRTPSASAQNAVAPGTAAALTQLSTVFNTALNSNLSGRTGIIPVNTFAFLNEVLASPAQFGFVNTTTPACTTASSLTCTPATLVNATAPTNFVFADGVHPTTAAHALFAQVVESEVTASQQAGLLAEQPLVTLETERNAVAQQLLFEQAAPSPHARVFLTGGFAHENFRKEPIRPADHDDWLVTAGVLGTLMSGLTVGAEVTAGRSHQNADTQLSHFRTGTLMGTVFAQYTLGRAYLSAEGGGGKLWYRDIRRAIALGPTTRFENGDTHGGIISANATAGYWFGGDALRVGPFARGIFERVTVNRYTEQSGDSTAMVFEGQNRKSFIGEAGARLQGSMPAGGAVIHPYAEIAYAHDGDAHRRSVLVGLTTMNGEFAVPGYRPDRNWGEAQAGISMTFAPGLSGSIGYQGRFAGHASAYNGANAGIAIAF
jgi:outer membrane lipase/esterase